MKNKLLILAAVLAAHSSLACKDCLIPNSVLQDARELIIAALRDYRRQQNKNKDFSPLYACRQNGGVVVFSPINKSDILEITYTSHFIIDYTQIFYDENKKELDKRWYMHLEGNTNYVTLYPNKKYNLNGEYTIEKHLPAKPFGSDFIDLQS